jgi:hypothetical protein
MGKVERWWNSFGYWLFPSHYDEWMRITCELGLARAENTSLTSNVEYFKQLHQRDTEAYSVLTGDWKRLSDRHAALVLELDSLKKKIVERSQVQPIIKAKTAAQVRNLIEQQNEREFEEANGIR